MPNRGLTIKDNPRLARAHLRGVIVDSPLNDDGKLKMRFYNKRSNAKREGIAFELSAEEFLQLLLEAGIKSSDLGIRGYQLARHNDAGAYRLGNCRFIPHTQNAKERKITEHLRATSSKTFKEYNKRKSGYGSMADR